MVSDSESVVRAMVIEMDKAIAAGNIGLFRRLTRKRSRILSQFHGNSTAFSDSFLTFLIDKDQAWLARIRRLRDSVSEKITGLKQAKAANNRLSQAYSFHGHTGGHMTTRG